jgi:PPOX class probable F420-dependent enzyme
MTSVSDPEITAFLSEGTRTGILGYSSASGRPLVVPVWFIVEDGTLVFNTGKDSAKGRSLARDPRATLCANLQEPPYGFVQVQADAELSEDPAELLRTATAIAARYMGTDKAEAVGRRNAGPGELVVRLRPTKVIAALNVTG